MNSPSSADPFIILGVSRDADESEVRARYLELVKQFPPEQFPDKFLEIRAAFEAAKDPLSIARRLIQPPSEEAPQWSHSIEIQKRNPPRLSVAFLLSLGNRPSGDSTDATANRLAEDSTGNNDLISPAKVTKAP